MFRHLTILIALTVTVVTTKSIDRPRIVGGEHDYIKKRPYMVSILYLNNYQCGGSILSESYILTAKHCVKANPSDYSVRSGSNFHNQNGTVTPVRKIIDPRLTHEGWIYDVAVLLLKEPLKFGALCRRIPLWNDERLLRREEKARVLGWGETREPVEDSHLRSVEVPIMDRKECIVKYAEHERKPSKYEFCAGYPKGKKDACKGDSGGPLVVTEKGEDVQIGIVTWGRGCASADWPGVYVNISMARRFINNAQTVT